jgi:hypothetical protein
MRKGKILKKRDRGEKRPTATCQFCGMPFPVYRYHQRFCDRACRIKYHNAIMKRKVSKDV